jgi:hypothetical protein
MYPVDVPTPVGRLTVTRTKIAQRVADDM